MNTAGGMNYIGFEAKEPHPCPGGLTSSYAPLGEPNLGLKGRLDIGLPFGHRCISGTVGSCVKMMSFLSLRAKPMKWLTCDCVRSLDTAALERIDPQGRCHSLKIL